jgi:hypothetical protein
VQGEKGRREMVREDSWRLEFGVQLSFFQVVAGWMDEWVLAVVVVVVVVVVQ